MSESRSGDFPKPTAAEALSFEARRGTGYPPPFDAIAKKRLKRALGDPFGLTQFGVNLVHLPPGERSSQRHWHRSEDEFVYMLEGEVVLITDSGETQMIPGMVAGFPAGCENAHHLLNKSESMAVYLEIGTRASEDVCDYPDIDLHYRHTGGQGKYTHKDGKPYDSQ